MARAPKLSHAVATSILLENADGLLSHKAIPDDFSAYCAGLRLPRQVDGWDHPFRLVKQENDARMAYLLISAGPDGRFDSRMISPGS